MTKSQKDIILETQRLACEMLQEIEDGSMGRDIVKKLAKHLFHKGYDKLDGDLEELEGMNVPQIEEIE